MLQNAINKLYLIATHDVLLVCQVQQFIVLKRVAIIAYKDVVCALFAFL